MDIPLRRSPGSLPEKVDRSVSIAAPPTLSTVLGNPAKAGGFPHSHSFRQLSLYMRPRPNGLGLKLWRKGVGQIKLPKMGWKIQFAKRTFAVQYLAQNLFLQWAVT